MLHDAAPSIACYFDYKAHARDLRHDYIVIEVGGADVIIGAA